MKTEDVIHQHTDRYVGKWYHYCEVYDRYFQKYIGRDVTVLEIGIAHGGSLQVWKKYFGSNAKIVGIDIEPKSMFTEPQIQTFCGSQRDTTFLQSVIDHVGIPDIVIDDGSHQFYDVITCFNFIFPLMTTGVYLIEDTQVAYTEGDKNYVSSFGSFIHGGPNGMKSISFHEGLIIMEKQPHVENKMIQNGTGQF